MQTAQVITFTKAIQGYKNYRLSPNGDVWSCYKYKTSIPTDEWRTLKPVLDRGVGYFLVTLVENGTRRNHFIHRLLATTFIPNPLNKPHVNHIDANKQNNSLSNLEWATCKENASHAAKLGLYEPSIEATRVEVVQLDRATNIPIGHFRSIHEAGRQTGIAWQNIWKVCNGRRPAAGGYGWKYL